jgi:SAM-dependent methyltransferase
VNEPGSCFRTLFFEVFDALPRQGPGDRASAARALGLCRGLPPAPAIVDLGCGVGGQTLQLADLVPDGSIVAIDLHPPSIERLRRAVVARGLERRVRPVVGDMANAGLPPGSFDLVWSEGALYGIGLPAALRVAHDLLRPGGYVAFTEAVWRRADPPPDVRALFDLDYPTMGWTADAVAAIRDAGLELVGHFVLPDAAWWDDFYTPMEARIAALRAAHAGDDEARAILDQLAVEPETHRRHAAFYAYAFFVARRPALR